MHLDSLTFFFFFKGCYFILCSWSFCFFLQEFMILPVGASSFKEAMKMGAEVYHHLKVNWRLLHFIYVAWMYLCLYLYLLYNEIITLLELHNWILHWLTLPVQDFVWLAKSKGSAVIINTIYFAIKCGCICTTADYTLINTICIAIKFGWMCTMADYTFSQFLVCD